MLEIYYFYTCLLRSLFCRHFVNEDAVVRSVKLIAESLAVRSTLPKKKTINLPKMKEWEYIMLTMCFSPIIWHKRLRGNVLMFFLSWTLILNLLGELSLLTWFCLIQLETFEYISLLITKLLFFCVSYWIQDCMVDAFDVYTCCDTSFLMFGIYDVTANMVALVCSIMVKENDVQLELIWPLNQTI